MRLIILGATGSLGAHVLRHALDAGHDVSVLVRDSSRLPAAARQRVLVNTGDLSAALPPEILRGHEALRTRMRQRSCSPIWIAAARWRGIASDSRCQPACEVASRNGLRDLTSR